MPVLKYCSIGQSINVQIPIYILAISKYITQIRYLKAIDLWNNLIKIALAEMSKPLWLLKGSISLTAPVEFI
jgi:hypothetical protein